MKLTLWVCVCVCVRNNNCFRKITNLILNKTLRLVLLLVLFVFFSFFLLSVFNKIIGILNILNDTICQHQCQHSKMLFQLLKGLQPAAKAVRQTANLPGSLLILILINSRYLYKYE